MYNAIKLYKIARFLYLKKIPFIPKLITLIIFIVYSSKISYKTKIGKGTFLVYGGIGVLINESAEIGENCSIGVNSMIVGKSPYRNAPKIGNRVFIGPGSVIVGPVVIEDNVVIAPNSVVTKSVAKDLIVAGNPAKIIGNINELDYDIFKNETFKEGYADYLKL
ncbi:serine O-acetyltransferase [Emticicia sp. BO119]|uniref:serine O-acetyltransferase n=1 Tax=Emticicia sp. BO119 TaxID=2757768 RepID=UPI0015F0FC30|nr:DapH/DapD/GlmU-related protein [Emticicia sp. BO119]MBA4850528.1 serine acetyltransferase [Emticicia sp. BO119]